MEFFVILLTVHPLPLINNKNFLDCFRENNQTRKIAAELRFNRKTVVSGQQKRRAVKKDGIQYIRTQKEERSPRTVRIRTQKKSSEQGQYISGPKTREIGRVGKY
jgi:hypothetical protein